MAITLSQPKTAPVFQTRGSYLQISLIAVAVTSLIGLIALWLASRKSQGLMIDSPLASLKPVHHRFGMKIALATLTIGSIAALFILSIKKPSLKLQPQNDPPILNKPSESIPIRQHSSGKISLKVKTGDIVNKGDPLFVSYAMKMENTHKAPRRGIVKQIFVTDGANVENIEVLRLELL